MFDSHVCHIVGQKVIYSILNTGVVILCQKVVSYICQQMIAGIWTVVNELLDYNLSNLSPMNDIKSFSGRNNVTR